MRSELSTRDRRAIRLGLVVLLPAFVLGLGVRPYASAWMRARDRLESERALLGRERALVDAAPSFGRAEATERSALERRAGRLLPGDSTLAGGALVRYVADL
ncbi:MAG: hypothetical protein P8099_19100, partial [Gemmatimonadota bacterium]